MSHSVYSCIALAVLIFLNLGLAQAQDFTFTAKVVDEFEDPIRNATLSLSDSLKTLTYGTDANGECKFTIKKGFRYKAVAKKKYFLPVRWNFVADTHKRQTFMLLPTENTELDSLVIQPDNSVIYKQDTIIYKLSAFTNKSERKLQDALKKIPGFQIENGRIKLNGRPIEKLTIDNKPFFGNNQRLALSQIPAKAIENVEAIDNYNESSIMGGNSGKLVLNLTLKEGKKNVIFGDVSLGGGITNRFENTSNLFYFGKTAVQLIANSNNTLNPSLEFSDIMEFYGGTSEILSQGAASFFRELNNSPLLRFTLTGEDRFRKENFVGLNLSHEFKNSLKISGFGIFNDLDIGRASAQDIQYLIDPTLQISENRTESEDLDQTNFVSKFRLVYKPHKRTELFVKTILSNVSGQQASRTLQQLTNDERQLTINGKQENFTLKSDATLHKKYSKRSKGSFALNLNYKDDNNTLLYSANENLFPSALNLEEAETYTLEQLQSPRLGNYSLGYKHTYNQMARKIWSLNTEINRQDYSINSRLIDVGENNNLNENIADIFRWNTRIGMEYEYWYKRLKFKFGLDFNHIATLHKQNSLERKNITQNFLVPSFKITKDFRPSEKLYVSYAYKVRTPRFINYLEQGMLNSFSLLTTGNPNLKNEQNHVVQAYYMKNIKYYNFTLNNSLTFNLLEKGILSFTQQEGLTAQQTVGLFANPSMGYTNQLNVTKGLWKKWRLALRHRYSQNWRDRFINSQKVENRTIRSQLELETRYIPSKRLSFTYGLVNGYNAFNAIERNSIAREWRHNFTTEIQFLKVYNLKTELYHTRVNDIRNQHNNFTDWHLELSRFHQETSLNFSLKIYNLLNNTARINNSLTEQILLRNEIFIQERFALLSVGWSF